MTEILNKEMPLCCVCETPTEADLHDPALGTICYACRQEVAAAEHVLRAAGMKDLLSTPKNNTQSH